MLEKGSGIFLHDDTTSGVTNGCIAIPPGTLDQVLGWLDPAQHPVIRIGTTSEVGAPSPLATSPNSGATPFRPDGVASSAPATVTLSSIGPAAFVVGTDGGVWWSTPAVANRWANRPPASWATRQWCRGAGRIDVFVEGGNNKLWQRWTGCSGCQWSPWAQPVGSDRTLASAPAVTSWAPGRLDVFVRGSDNTLWQTFMINGVWQGWFQPPGTANGTPQRRPPPPAPGPNDTVCPSPRDRQLLLRLLGATPALTQP